jgi:hypothetical protein
MNERIRELALQAGSTHKQNLGVYQFYTDELEKFAELIVQECVDICQDTDGEEDAMALCGRQDCAVEIREHFGVEE